MKPDSFFKVKVPELKEIIEGCIRMNKDERYIHLTVHVASFSVWVWYVYTHTEVYVLICCVCAVHVHTLCVHTRPAHTRKLLPQHK